MAGEEGKHIVLGFVLFVGRNHVCRPHISIHNDERVS